MLKKIKLSETFNILFKAYGRYKWQIVGMILLGFLGGLFEGISIGALIPLFSILVSNQMMAQDPISRSISALFEYLPFSFSITSLLALIVILFTAKVLALLLFGQVRVRIISNYKRDMMRELFEGALFARWGFLLQQKLGYLQSTFIRDVQNGAGLFMSLGHAILAFTTLFMYFLVALNISPMITLLTLGIGGVTLISLRPLVKIARHVAEDMSKLEKDTTQHINQYITGMKAVKSSAAETSVLKKGIVYLDSLRNLTVKSDLRRSLSTVFIQPASLIFISMLFIFSYRDPYFNLAAFIATIYLVQKIFLDVESIQRSFHAIADLLPYTADAVELKEDFGKFKEENRGTEPFAFEKKIEFRDITFGYTPEKMVLDGLNLAIHKGEVLGLVGPSGGGKTSLADLLLRLFRPGNGVILVDGKNVEGTDLKNWRDHLGYVSQDIFLLNDTIGQNIRFYREELTSDDIIDAAKQANICDFILSLKDGFETLVGERGVMLSAGQRQRIVLARELAHRPEILILDEATSSLDGESEMLIQKSINNLKSTKTIFMIAHRLSTLVDVDRLLVLDKVKIIEEGRPEELLADPTSYFYRLYHIKEL